MTGEGASNGGKRDGHSMSRVLESDYRRRWVRGNEWAEWSAGGNPWMRSGSDFYVQTCPESLSPNAPPAALNVFPSAHLVESEPWERLLQRRLTDLLQRTKIGNTPTPSHGCGKASRRRQGCWRCWDRDEGLAQPGRGNLGQPRPTSPRPTRSSPSANLGQPQPTSIKSARGHQNLVILVIPLLPKYGAEFNATIPPQLASGKLRYAEEIIKGLDKVGDVILAV
ncbi:hypothetical protein B0H19DRAFT_1340722 [Mycena capillaripes]|nr:hypothetical protein B0H19DRAFT_1340722 [Mycena capillaripes]